MTTTTNCDEITKAIAYYRVSTAKQGDSGLGLDAQRATVEAFAKSRCHELVASFTEVETGTAKRERPELVDAIALAKEQDAYLLIAKLDRLARNVAFTSALMESGVKFVACDMPDANSMTIHIIAAVAENEAKLISQRTKAALDAKRTRDGEWRVSNLDDSARQRSIETRKKNARAATAQLENYVRMMRASGDSYRAIADQLNRDGYTTRRGKPFSAMAVKRLYERAVTPQ